MPRKSFTTIAVLFATILLMNQVKFAKAYPLDITVNTDKSIYNVGEIVQISGDLKYYNSPLSGALVALQINDRAVPYALRTLYTGTLPSGPWYVEITNVYIGDSDGNPLNNITRGAVCYIWIFYKNTYQYSLPVTIAFTIYDANQSPLFAQIPVSQSVPPGDNYFVRYSWQIPTDAEVGIATVYASIFTAPPEDGGYPHSPEKSNVFNIIKTSMLSTYEGTYDTSFQIATRNTRIGNYNVYVASFYAGYTATSTTSYQVILLGDINGDLYVNIKDAVLLNGVFGSQEGDPNWDPRCDLNNDGYVNIKDAVILNSNFGNSAI
jgi:hypothetical protein